MVKTDSRFNHSRSCAILNVSKLCINALISATIWFSDPRHFEIVVSNYDISTRYLHPLSLI